MGALRDAVRPTSQVSEVPAVLAEERLRSEVQNRGLLPDSAKRAELDVRLHCKRPRRSLRVMQALIIFES